MVELLEQRRIRTELGRRLGAPRVVEELATPPYLSAGGAAHPRHVHLGREPLLRSAAEAEVLQHAGEILVQPLAHPGWH